MNMHDKVTIDGYSNSVQLNITNKCFSRTRPTAEQKRLMAMRDKPHHRFLRGVVEHAGMTRSFTAG